MACTGDRDKIYAYRKGRMTPQEKAEFEAHIISCVPCRRELEQEKQLDEWFAVWHTPAPSLGFETRFKARLNEEKTKATGKVGLRWPVFSALSALCIVSGLVLWHFAMPLKTRGTNEMVLAENLEVLEKLDMLQQWDMLQHWDEISGVKPLEGDI